ncbi:hypothetical protein HDZ31DRAFT_42085 [Schizophyllum fasciatum]
MSKAPVPLDKLSLTESVPTAPLNEHTLVAFDKERDYQRIWTPEWYLGLPKGKLPLESDLNRLEMRAYMLQAYKEDGFMLVPTAATMKAMSAMLRRNNRATIRSRKRVLQVFPSQYHEYELRPMGLNKPSKRPTIYIDVGEAAPRAIPYPYGDLPNVLSRANPYFVLYMAHEIVMNQGLLYYAHEVKPIWSPILKVTQHWMRAPPVEFRYGRHLSKEHRHPTSLADAAVRASSRSSNAPDTPDDDCEPQNAESRARDAEEKSHPSATPSLGKRKRQGDTETDLANAPPRRCSRTLVSPVAEDDLFYAERSEILAWLNGIEAGDEGYRSASESELAEADAALAQYVQEPLRSPEEVMRTGRRVWQGSTPPGQKRDTSRFCSNQWAEKECAVYLWGYRDERQS